MENTSDFNKNKGKTIPIERKKKGKKICCLALPRQPSTGK
jgi:hypothetical protein